MMTEHEKLNNHEKFKELGALANSGTLTGSERADLKDHLETCEECRQIYDQYLILASEGIPLLAALYGDQEEKCWRDLSTRMKLFARVQSAEQQTLSEPTSQMRLAAQPHLLWRILVNPLTSVGLAACFVLAVGIVHHVVAGPGEHLGLDERVLGREPARPEPCPRETGSDDGPGQRRADDEAGDDGERDQHAAHLDERV